MWIPGCIKRVKSCFTSSEMPCCLAKGMFVFCISKVGMEMTSIYPNLPKLEVHFLAFFSNFWLYLTAFSFALCMMQVWYFDHMITWSYNYIEEILKTLKTSLSSIFWRRPWDTIKSTRSVLYICLRWTFFTVIWHFKHQIINRRIDTALCLTGVSFMSNQGLHKA